jgi:putative endonuclease
LQCSDGTYYTGITNNLELRLAQHKSGFKPGTYTFYRRPVKLVFHEMYYDVRLAIEWEKRLKGWSRAKKEAIIKDQWDKLYGLSECKNESHSKYFRDLSGFDSAQPDNDE